MNHTPRTRTVAQLHLLLVRPWRRAPPPAGARIGTRSPAKPYDAADQITFSTPDGDSSKADPDKPLEVTAKGDDGRITDVTATDATGRYVRGRTRPPTAARWRTTAPLAPAAATRSG